MANLQPDRAIPKDKALAALAVGSLRLSAQVPWSSNATFVGRVVHEGVVLPVVYKPRRGEAPLWDFPRGTLCLREMAAFVLCEALSWGFIPATVLREGPYGYGAVQSFIDHDPDEHFLALTEPDGPTIQRIVAFDVVANNGDRKSGHILQDLDGALWAIDHGLCFHEEPKLRTVVWHLAGQPLPRPVLRDLAALGADLGTSHSAIRDRLAGLLTDSEREALFRRVGALVAAGSYPHPDGDRRAFPWPPV